MTPPTPGDVIWAYAGTKTRPCVVLRVVDGAAIVLVAGTSTARDDARVEVVAGSREAARMGLSGTTYFYGRVERVSLAAFASTSGTCPPATFAALRKLVGD